LNSGREELIACMTGYGTSWRITTPGIFSGYTLKDINYNKNKISMALMEIIIGAFIG
jgi:hypothetical protein